MHVVSLSLSLSLSKLSLSLSETSLGKASMKEKMFLLSPTPGTNFTVKELVSQVPNEDASIVNGLCLEINIGRTVV